MQTPIKDMYTAAKVNIPAQGDMVTGVANTLQETLSTLDKQAAYAGDPAALTSLLHVGGDVHNVLLVAVESLDNMAAALIATANHYVETDAQAAADYGALSQETKNAPLPDHNPNELDGKPEDPGAPIPGPEYGPFPPGQGGGHVDPSPDPGSAQEEQDDRDDQVPEQPDVPRPEQVY